MQQEDPGPARNGTDPEGATGAGSGLVRVGLYFYGAMIGAALLWRMGLYGESILFASPAAEAAGARPLRDLLIGLLMGGAVVGISSVVTNRTSWGDALARSLGRSLRDLRVPDAVLLAFASGLGEELFFRGALQPRVGLVVASLIFGAVHFVPRREMLPWTVFAVAAGLLFGAVFEWTGNVIAPVVAHIVVNGVNLPLLIRQYGGEAPDPEEDPDVD